MIAVLQPTAAALVAFLLATGAGFSDEGSYEPSAAQSKVDDSISTTRIYTPLADVADRLTMIVQDDCDKWGECQWQDADGVRYYFWGDGPDDLHVVAKTVRADEFEGRSISALGIGSARGRDRVLAAARSFVPGADFECGKLDDDDTDLCNVTLHPGWVTIRFDASGSLTEVQLDGYHYT